MDFAGVHASPSVRRTARELGVDLAEVKGTGPKGRITKDDLLAFLRGPAQPAAAAAPAADVYVVLVSRLHRTSWRVRVIERSSGSVAHGEWFEAEADARRRFRTLRRDAACLDPAAFRARHGLP
jgi:pyruvate/2-oxoglutarate dehydrogenase complex dihydrolipoamide acyltransferase (E2) component